MGFSDFVNKAKDLADQHDEQVDRGLDMAGDQANKRLAGHESQVDGLVDKAKQYTGEGDTTAALALPGSDVQLMIDAHDAQAPVGPIFVVESLATFHAGRPESLTVVEEPSEIPGGFQAIYREPGGAILYVIDQSTDAASGEG